ncbi:MAG: NADP-dependent glyceraldehyde-3-phosphate dehydrogenase [Cytophagales bacterium]
MSFQEKLQSIFIEETAIPQEYKLEKEVNQREYLQNGELKTWTGDVHTVVSPICVKTPAGLQRKVIGSYPLCTEKEANEALEAAIAAYNHGRGEWPSMSVSDRIACLEKFTYKMIERKKEVVTLLLWEIGKSVGDSTKEFDRTVEYMQATIDALKDSDRSSSRFEVTQGIIGQIRRAPLGVVLCMGPFNYPLNETFTTLIPALVMGNVILFKPPKHGTLLFAPLLEAFKDCFPKGAVNTIYGRGNAIIPSLMQSGKIDVLTLIGSSRVADSLKKMHPKSNRLRAVLGLDAKNAAIITASADIEITVKEAVLGSLSFNGQRCTALKIFFVHKSVVDNFTKRLSEEIAKLKFGMPWDKDVFLTPLPEPNKPAYLKECIDDAIANGAKIMNENGGTTLESFVYPAVLYPVNSRMKIYKEEQFGPVVPIVSFENLEEPIQYLIDADHGQQVSIFSNDANEIASLVDPLVNQVSRVNINAQCQRGPDTFPFTGRKDSAEGTLSVTSALRAFSIRSMVATKMTEANKKLLNDVVSSQKSHFISTKYIF